MGIAIKFCCNKLSEIKFIAALRIKRREANYSKKEFQIPRNKWDQKGEDLSTRTWLGDVQYEDNPASICGLEISFSSVPQDIDIKLIPGNSNCAVDNKEPGPDTNKAEAGPTHSSSEDPLETEPDLNKTRQ